MEAIIAMKFPTLKPEWNERPRRLWVASEAMCLGHGGVSIVSRATGLSRPTILQGIKKLNNSERLAETRVRREGAGRKKQPQTNRTCYLPSTPSSNRLPRVILCRPSAGQRTAHIT